MIKNFDGIIQGAKKIGPKTIAVACAEDEALIKAVETARINGIANAILVGNREKIRNILQQENIDEELYDIIDSCDNKIACDKVVWLAKTGRASIIMKGLVDTSQIIGSILNKKTGLSISGLLSHVGLLKVEQYDRFFILSDSAMNIQPTLEEKVQIIKNAVRVANAVGIQMPKVAVICPVEKVSEKIISTVHAAELVKMNEVGKIKGCIIGGPLALDNAISKEAALCKSIDHPVAGNADILIASGLEAGNVLNKSMEYFGKAEKAGVIMGACSPIVLTSRSSSSTSKFNSIALAVLLSNNNM